MNNNKEVNINYIEPLNLVDPKDRTFFVLNEMIKVEENKRVEFKNYSYPLPRKLVDIIKNQICGFLNSEGGRIYFGINDQGRIKGMYLTPKQKDLFRNELVNYTSQFYPSCRTEKLSVIFYPIRDSNSNKYLRDLYITKLVIKQGDTDKLYSITQKPFTSYIRMDGQVVQLSAEEITKFIVQRNKSPNKVVDEELYTDPEPEKPELTNNFVNKPSPVKSNVKDSPNINSNIFSNTNVNSNNNSNIFSNISTSNIDIKDNRDKASKDRTDKKDKDRDKEKSKNSIEKDIKSSNFDYIKYKGRKSKDKNESSVKKNDVDYIIIKINNIPTQLKHADFVKALLDNLKYRSHNIFVDDKGNCLGWGFVNLNEEKEYKDLLRNVTILNETNNTKMTCKRKHRDNKKTEKKEK